MIFHLSSEDIYLSLTFSFAIVSELFCCELFETFELCRHTTQLPRQRLCYQSNLFVLNIPLL